MVGYNGQDMSLERVNVLQSSYLENKVAYGRIILIWILRNIVRM
jgi:hypothetical protein